MLNDCAGEMTGIAADHNCTLVDGEMRYVLHVPGVVVPSRNPRFSVPPAYVTVSVSSQPPMTTAIVAVWLTTPLVARTVSVYLPGGAVWVATDSTEVPPLAIDDGENAAVASPGRPVTDRLIVPVNPIVPVT